MTVSEYNKAAIINAAAGIFKKYGFAKTSISDISTVLDKGRTSVYKHFKSKEEIFTAVVESHTSIYFNELNSLLLTRKNASEKLAVFCNVKFNFIHSLQKEFVLLHDEIIHQSNLKNSLAKEIAVKEIKIIESIIKAGIKNSEFKPLPLKQIKLTASLFHTMIKAAVNNLHENAGTKNFTTAGKIVESMLISSLINKAS